jgi:hypothetical protein
MEFSLVEWAFFGSIAVAVVLFQDWFFLRSVTDYEKKGKKKK